MTAFVVIDGGPEPADAVNRLRQKATGGPIIRCRRCTGLATIEVRLGMQERNGKATGGQPARICATCLVRGEYVIV